VNWLNVGHLKWWLTKEQWEQKIKELKGFIPAQVWFDNEGVIIKVINDGFEYSKEEWEQKVKELKNK